MERKIGEIFEYNGEWYQCVEQPEKYDKTVCALCAFQGNGNCELDRCSGTYRSDKKFVIFKKLEKVGEPVTERGRTFQRLNAFKTECTGCVFLNSERGCDKDHYIDDPCPDREIWAEIKQSKEDMEENKTTFPKENNTLTRIVDAYVNEIISDKDLIRSIKEMSDEYPYNKNNLKPFDFEAAKAGNPVCTRDGRKARIICFDRKLFYRKVSYPILALVERSDGEDDVCAYNEKGKVLIEDGAEYKDDLMMLPEKKEGWVNVYMEETNNNERLIEQVIYKTRKDAFDNACPRGYKATVKINWEE